MNAKSIEMARILTYIDIQKDIVKRFRITLDPNSKCWSRMHVHVKQRRVCKFHYTNSIQATFSLLHEVGHIECYHSGMRRAEDEYAATVWALKTAKDYGLTVPEKTIDVYQDYIDREKARGERRGGKGYGNLDLRLAME